MLDGLMFNLRYLFFLMYLLFLLAYYIFMYSEASLFDMFLHVRPCFCNIKKPQYMNSLKCVFVEYYHREVNKTLQRMRWSWIQLLIKMEGPTGASRYFSRLESICCTEFLLLVCCTLSFKSHIRKCAFTILQGYSHLVHWWGYLLHYICTNLDTHHFHCQ